MEYKNFQIGYCFLHEEQKSDAIYLIIAGECTIYTYKDDN